MSVGNAAAMPVNVLLAGAGGSGLANARAPSEAAQDRLNYADFAASADASANSASSQDAAAPVAAGTDGATPSSPTKLPRSQQQPAARGAATARTATADAPTEVLLMEPGDAAATPPLATRLAEATDADPAAEGTPPAQTTLSQQMLALLAGSLAITAPAPPAQNAVTLPVADTSATGAGTGTASALMASNAASQLQQSPGLAQAGALSALLDPRAAASTDTPADALKLALNVAADADAGSTFAVQTDKDDRTSLFGLSGTGATAPTLDRPLTSNAVTATPLAMPTRPDDGFDDGLGARIGWMAEQKLGHAQIRLNPENAGPIDVRIQLDGSQVNASFHSASAEVRQALEASLPRLREMLGQQGMQLGNTDIGQGQAQQQSGQGQPAPHLAAGSSDTGAPVGIAATPAPILVRSRGLLDEYA
jgi:flagellar hook-length control protein FliK